MVDSEFRRSSSIARRCCSLSFAALSRVTCRAQCTDGWGWAASIPLACGHTSSSGSTEVLAALTTLIVEPLPLSIESVGGGGGGFLPGGGGKRCCTLARKVSSPVSACRRTRLGEHRWREASHGLGAPADLRALSAAPALAPCGPCGDDARGYGCRTQRECRSEGPRSGSRRDRLL